MSVMATLATGVLEGPAGSGIISGGNVAQFFSDLLGWYGNNIDQTSPVAGYNDHGNPIATLPTSSQFDLDAQLPTSFEDFNVYVPWVSFAARADLPPSFQITSVQDVNGQPVIPLDLDQYLTNAGQDAGLASMTGPFTAEDNGYIPAGQPLAVHDQLPERPRGHDRAGPRSGSPPSSTPASTPARSGWATSRSATSTSRSPATSRSTRATFDFSRTKGFDLYVSAGVDIQTGIATWLIEAIDPLTGAVITNPNLGLLPPNNAEGAGAGFVTFTVLPRTDVTTGTTLTATATVLFNNAPPQDTAPLDLHLRHRRPHHRDHRDPARHERQLPGDMEQHRRPGRLGRRLRDAVRRRGRRLVPDLAGPARRGLRHDGLPGPGRAHLHVPGAGHRRGRQPRAAPGPGQRAPGHDDRQPRRPAHGPQHHAAQLRHPAGAGGPALDQPAVHPGRSRASPTAPPASNPSEFQTVLQPFQAQSFATGFVPSDGILGPMAMAQAPDGSFLVSGGASRNELFRFPQDGGTAGTPLATLPYQIYALAFDNDGNLWAATGGGPLLQLDPTTGAIVNQFGDGITLALAVDPRTDEIYVATGQGVSIFDPANDTFTQYSRDQNLRVSSLAFDNQGQPLGGHLARREPGRRVRRQRPRPGQAAPSTRTSSRSPSASRARRWTTSCSSRTTTPRTPRPAPSPPRPPT